MQIQSFYHHSPWEKYSVTPKHFVILAADQTKKCILCGQRFSSPLTTVQESAEDPAAPACPRPCTNRIVQTMVKDTDSRVLARSAGGNLSETAGIGTGSHQPPRQEHPCEILQGQASDCRKGTWTLRRWGFYAACLRMYRVRYQHTSAKWISLGCLPN